MQVIVMENSESDTAASMALANTQSHSGIIFVS